MWIKDKAFHEFNIDHSVDCGKYWSKTIDGKFVFWNTEVEGELACCGCYETLEDARKAWNQHYLGEEIK